MSARTTTTTTTTKGLRAAVEVERSLSRLKPERPALGSGIRPEAPLAPSLATFDRPAATPGT